MKKKNVQELTEKQQLTLTELINQTENTSKKLFYDNVNLNFYFRWRFVNNCRKNADWKAEFKNLENYYEDDCYEFSACRIDPETTTIEKHKKIERLFSYFDRINKMLEESEVIKIYEKIEKKLDKENPLSQLDQEITLFEYLKTRAKDCTLNYKEYQQTTTV